MWNNNFHIEYIKIKVNELEVIRAIKTLKWYSMACHDVSEVMVKSAVTSAANPAVEGTSRDIIRGLLDLQELETQCLDSVLEK